jgi:glycosyltransferase involved in cell wall biosynthesis
MEGGDEVLVLAGTPPPHAGGEAPITLIPELEYDRLRPAAERGAVLEDGRRLAVAIAAAIHRRWAGGAGILHAHNPLIKKNAALLPALRILQEQGMRLLLQNHDLAEDFRPDVYSEGTAYLENCHYAAVNSRDYAFLRQAGLQDAGLHLLPNETAPVQAVPGLDRKRYLYPVRAIRRKNIGEALLLSCFIPQGRTVAVTMPPNSEEDWRIYRRWAVFAEEHRLPMEFEAGAGKDFGSLLGGAYGVLTTSIKEGFGFSFLEPWTAGRAVVGRRIDHVCRDFEAAGVVFQKPQEAEGESLYRSLEIPVERLDFPALQSRMEQAFRAVYTAFNEQPPDWALQSITETLRGLKTIDFGRLDEDFQAGVIQSLLSSEQARRDIAGLNPFLAGLADWRPDEELIAANREHIAQSYGRARISALLRKTYTAVLNASVTHSLSKSRLLELYLNPLNFSLIGCSQACMTQP